MPGVDLMGQHGGELAAAYAGGFVSATGIMMAAGRWVWTKFGDKRIDELKTELAAVKAAREDDQRDYERQRERDRLEFNRILDRHADRIMVLEGLLIQAGGGLRQAMQAALSETNVRVTEVAHGAVKLEEEPKQ
ncbi:hypothetical protein [Sphingomonas sp.]|uniref:hypothetical protein n=1 Tax=Sphingomonas sp. TaxID=28214 RepID=UPI002FDA7D8C